MLLQHLWPKLKMVAVIDVRMSTTAMFADIVLPAAQQYEKISFGIPSTHTLNLTFSDRSLEPAGEAKGEWAIFRDLVAKIEERAKARGITEYKDVKGAVHKFEGMYNTMTANGALHEEETLTDEMVRDSATAGTLPEGSSLATLRDKGFIRFTALGSSPRARGQASEVEPDQTFAALQHHTEKKMPYPTLVRRAQYYIDHPWFIDAGEELPCHKDPPASGGDYPLMVTSGHNRWSIHSNNIVNKMMQQTNRGTPHAEVNPDDAAARRVKNGDKISIFNDMGRMNIEAKLSTSVRPGQVIIYNGWEPYQFEKWWDINNLEPGMFKWLHLAGGYGHLKYWPTEWQPCPVMRATRVDFEPANGKIPGGREAVNGH
jgi:nitrate reductase alpha subunit